MKKKKSPQKVIQRVSYKGDDCPLKVGLNTIVSVKKNVSKKTFTYIDLIHTTPDKTGLFYKIFNIISYMM